MDDHYRRPSPVTNDEIDPLDEVRYYGIPTLLRAPVADSLERLDVALAGVPFDAGATNRPGARFGPAAIREVSSGLETYDPQLDVDGLPIPLNKGYVGVGMASLSYWAAWRLDPPAACLRDMHAAP